MLRIYIRKTETVSVISEQPSYLSHNSACKGKTGNRVRSEENRKDRPLATASVGGVANLSHDIFYSMIL